MLEPLRKISPRGWLTLAQWTVFGTLGCILIALILNAIAFHGLGSAAFERAMLTGVVIPTMVAGPLFFYLTLKLRELAIANHKLGVIASTDSLTSVLNRGAFSAQVHSRLGAAVDGQGAGAFLVIDADHFKTINDRYGHDKGDEALRIIAGAIRSSIRQGDLVGRLGGEEFGVFLPGATHENACAIAERIRALIEKTPFLPDGRRCKLSVSVGGASFEEALRFSELFRIADERLYVAKHAGRNRVSMTLVPPHAPFEEAPRLVALH